jgi:hypothetical protein
MTARRLPLRLEATQPGLHTPVGDCHALAVAAVRNPAEDRIPLHHYAPTAKQ